MTASPPELTPGVHRVTTSPREALAAWCDSGWRAVLVEPAGSAAELYTSLARALGLPAWFGRNLDALWDCLTDLEEPTALVLQQWDRLADGDPEHAVQLLRLFGDRTEVDPPFAAVLA